MASAEYYLGTAGAHALKNQNQPPPPQQYPQHQSYGNTPPPSYASYAPSQAPQPVGMQSQHQPYPSNGRPAAVMPSFPPPPTQPQNYAQQPNNHHLSVPARSQRSHSQPPRVRFADDNTYGSDYSTEFEYDSDSPSSDHSTRRRHHHHQSTSTPRKHRHSHSHHAPNSSSNSRSHERERDPHRSRSRSHSNQQSSRPDHKHRDTFLGAGAGGLVGDLIFPGLGTAAGLLIGGYGGRKRAQRRSRSESGGSGELKEHRGHRSSGRSRMDSGWDEESATFKKGSAVR